MTAFQEPDKAEATQDPARDEPGNAPHQLAAWALATLRIMWFALRHPGRAAWVDHKTGEVRPAGQTIPPSRYDLRQGQGHRPAGPRPLGGVVKITWSR